MLLELARAWLFQQKTAEPVEILITIVNHNDFLTVSVRKFIAYYRSSF